MHKWSLKLVCALGVAGSLLSSCGSDDEPKPNTPITRTPITVSVSEAGAANYNLRDAYVESATYDAKISSASLVGKLAVASSCRWPSSASPTAPAPAPCT